jgi:probable O-glycosylation ligase (exosortase A-associated)
MGPEDSMIRDNNNLGLALVMILPLIYYLGLTTRQRFVSLGCYAVMGLTILAVLGTYSRGALVAIGAMGLAFVVKNRAGVVPLILCGLLVVSLPYVVPDAWFQRMTTIADAKSDESFGERLQAWKTNVNIANARPLTGGGFSATELDWVATGYQSPGSLPFGRAAHSIYFEVLGDHGYVGLALYLALLAAALYNTISVRRFVSNRPELRWASRLSDMLQISIVGYLVGGAALSMAYYDGFIVLLTLTAALNAIVRQPAAEKLTGSPLWTRPKWNSALVGARTPSAE